jgi:hypothetical protein
VQTEDEERCAGKRENQRHGMDEEPEVGRGQAAVLEQQEGEQEGSQRRPEVVRKDEERARDFRHRPARREPQSDRTIVRYAQQRRCSRQRHSGRLPRIG